MANLVQDSQDKQVIYKLWVITMIIILDHCSNKTRLLAATSVSMKSLTKNLSLKYVSCQKAHQCLHITMTNPLLITMDHYTKQKTLRLPSKAGKRWSDNKIFNLICTGFDRCKYA